MTPIELQKKGFQALVNNLKIVDAIRFIHQYDSGSEDYKYIYILFFSDHLKYQKSVHNPVIYNSYIAFYFLKLKGIDIILN